MGKTKQKKQIKPGKSNIPNSAEETLCMECNTIVKEADAGMQCEDCFQWWHTNCLGLTSEQYNFIVQNDQFHWFCLTCNPFVDNRLQESLETRKLVQRLEQLETQLGVAQTPASTQANANLEQGNKAISAQLENLERKIQTDLDIQKENLVLISRTLQREIATCKKDFTDATQDIRGELTGLKRSVSCALTDIPKMKESMKEFIDEQEEKFRRLCNVIIFNVPEPLGEDPNSRRLEDTQRLQELFKHLSIWPGNFDPVIRIGRYLPHRTRPIRITVPSTQVKRDLLAAARKSEFTFSPNTTHVKMCPDRTMNERQRLQTRNLQPGAQSTLLNKHSTAPPILSNLQQLNPHGMPLHQAPLQGVDPAIPPLITSRQRFGPHDLPMHHAPLQATGARNGYHPPAPPGNMPGYFQQWSQEPEGPQVQNQTPPMSHNQCPPLHGYPDARPMSTPVFTPSVTTDNPQE